jgi:hypothetical protein
LLNEGAVPDTEGEGGASSASMLKIRFTVGVTVGSQHAQEQMFLTIFGFGQGVLGMVSWRRQARLCAVLVCGNNSFMLRFCPINNDDKTKSEGCSFKYNSLCTF